MEQPNPRRVDAASSKNTRICSILDPFLDTLLDTFWIRNYPASHPGPGEQGPPAGACDLPVRVTPAEGWIVRYWP